MHSRPWERQFTLIAVVVHVKGTELHGDYVTYLRDGVAED